MINRIKKLVSFLFAFFLVFSLLSPLEMYAQEPEIQVEETEDEDEFETAESEPKQESKELEQEREDVQDESSSLSVQSEDENEEIHVLNDTSEGGEESIKTVNVLLEVGKISDYYTVNGTDIEYVDCPTWAVMTSISNNQVYFQAGNYPADMLGREGVIRVGDTEFHLKFYLNVHVHVYEITEMSEDGTEILDAEANPDLDYSMKYTSMTLLYQNLEGYSYYGSSRVYKYNNSWNIDYYYMPETGEYVMDSPTDTGNMEDYDSTNGTNYVLRDMTSLEDGHLVADEVYGVQFSSGHMYVTKDGDSEKVWCIDPETLTFNLSKYEKREVPENTRAAIAIIYGFNASTATDLDLAIIEAYVWSTLGYDVPFEQMGKVKEYDEFNDEFIIEDLSEEEMNYVLDTVARLNAAADAYEASKQATFTSKTEGVTIENGRLVIEGDIPKTIVLETDDVDMLLYYSQYGQMNFADGITGIVDLANKQLILSIDSDVIQAGATISMSMVPRDFSTVTNEYYSNYHKQNLASFGLSDQKLMSIVIALHQVTISPTATKNLVGADLKAGQFTFALKDASGNIVGTATNDADGNIVFSGLTFTKVGTYTYTLYEVNDSQEGMSYDSSIYTVTIVVTEVDNQLIAEITTPGVSFKNTFEEKEDETKDEKTESQTQTQTKSQKQNSVMTSLEQNTDQWIVLAGFSFVLLVVLHKYKKLRI